MWPDDFWTDDFWATDFWASDEDSGIYDIIIIDGDVSFPITLDSDTGLSRGSSGGRFTCPVQDSYGGLIRLGHNFPFDSSYTAQIGYESPDGKFGEIDAYDFDADYVKAIIPEGLFDLQGRYWKFNIIVSGSRNGKQFRIRSKSIKIRVLDGLIDETV